MVLLSCCMCMVESKMIYRIDRAPALISLPTNLIKRSGLSVTRTFKLGMTPKLPFSSSQTELCAGQAELGPATPSVIKCFQGL